MKHLFRNLLIVFSLVAGWSSTAFSQLDSEHWIPPMHGRSYIQDHYLYLSTPETTPFSVSIYNGNGTLVTTVTISNAAPQKYFIGNGENTPVMVHPDLLNTVLISKGLKLIAPKKFYCNLRTKSADHGGSLTAKGRAALGTTFRIGHLYAEGGAHFVGVMATENNTVVTFSQFRPGVYLQTGTGGNDIFLANSPISVTLNAGQCYVISQYNNNDQDNFTNGLFGLLVSATKPIAVNCGTWFGLTVNGSGGDVGIDQIAPLGRCGTEYILMRGAGPSSIEWPLVVGHFDGTEVYINDDPTPFPLDAGRYMRIFDANYFDANNALVGNIYIRTTKPVFMYQSLGGGESENAALNFVPPISCQIGNDINNIPFISEIGNNNNFVGDVQILAPKNASVQLFRNSIPVPLPAPQNVRGNNDYVTIRYSGLPSNAVSHIRIQSDGPVQVSIARKNEHIGWGGYYSGFEKVFIPDVNITAHSQCSDTLFLYKQFINGGVSWYHNGQAFIPANDSVLIVTQPGDYMAIGKYITYCGEEISDTSYYTVLNNLVSISTEVTTINCIEGQLAGQIIVNASGNAPLEYSLNNGAFVISSVFNNVLQPGNYTVRVRNAQGCIVSSNVQVPANPVNMYSAVVCPGEVVSVGGQVFGVGNTSGLVYIPRPNSCDSIIQVTVIVHQPAILNIHQVMCQGENLIVGDSIFHEYNPAGTVVIQGGSYSGCDSIIDVQLQYGFVYTRYTFKTSCNPVDTGIVIQNLQTYLGCDSTVITNTTFDISNIDTLTQTLYTCDAAEVGVDTVFANGVNWCNGININTTQFIVTQYIEYQQRTCNPALAGTETLFFGCDSVVTITTLFDSSLIPIREETIYTCHPDAVGIDTLHYGLGECDSLRIITHLFDPKLIPVINVVAEDEPCEGWLGSIDAIVTQGGTSPFEYTLNGGTASQNTGFFDELGNGIYTVMVSDANGCTVQVTTEIKRAEGFLVTLGPDAEIKRGDTIMLQPVVTPAGHTVQNFDWGDTPGLICPACLNTPVAPTANTTYMITVWNMNGCPAYTSINVRVTPDKKWYLPNIFQINAVDPTNQLLTIYGNEDIATIELFQVFDRWGEMVFENRNFLPNDPSTGWNGYFRGKLAHQDVYVVQAKIKYSDGSTEMVTQDVTLLVGKQ